MKTITKDEEDTRPSYMKKRVIVPSVAAVLFVILGIYFAIHSIHFQSTDDAFVEGRLVSVAPRVAAPVINLLVDDNQPVKAGTLLVELDPKDFEVALAQAEARLAEAKAGLNMSEKKVDESTSKVNKSFEDSLYKEPTPTSLPDLLGALGPWIITSSFLSITSNAFLISASDASRATPSTS